MNKISICIPTYEYDGYGKECLEVSFSTLKEQTFMNFEIIISDHSKDDVIEKLCSKWKSTLNIKYFRNEKDRGNPASNANNAFRQATGKWIKFLCQDDYLLDSGSLQKIVNAMDENTNWIASAYIHTKDRETFYKRFVPSVSPHMYVINLLGTPSCMTFRNVKNMIAFDSNLIYCWDCDFYYRFFLKYGEPKIITDTTMVNYVWDKSITSSTTDEMINAENMYILRKYGFIK